MINIVLFGPPGSGKGTQAKEISKKFCLKHISTGDLFRYNLQNNTFLGKKAQFYMNKGELVPDNITSLMLSDEIKKNINNNVGFIFDGYPRTLHQAKYLDNFLTTLNKYILITILLYVDNKILFNRLLNRGQTSGRFDDIDFNILKKRINEYYTKTIEVKNYYKQQNKLIIIDGVGSIYEITDIICKTLKKYL